MPITIIQPKPIPRITNRDDGASSNSDSDSDTGGVDLEGDLAMSLGRPAKRAKHDSNIVTPGEVITDDTQYMRFVKGTPLLSFSLVLCLSFFFFSSPFFFFL